MYGARYQWIIPGGYPENWWMETDSTITCTPDELNTTLHGYISTDILPLSSSPEVTESGLVSISAQTPRNIMIKSFRKAAQTFGIFSSFLWQKISFDLDVL